MRRGEHGEDSGVNTLTSIRPALSSPYPHPCPQDSIADRLRNSCAPQPSCPTSVVLVPSRCTQPRYRASTRLLLSIATQPRCNSSRLDRSSQHQCPSPLVALSVPLPSEFWSAALTATTSTNEK